MPSEIVRLDLPSGNWWDVEVQPRWGEMMQIRREMVRIADADGADEEALTAIMAALTRGWSYRNGSEDTVLPISIDSVNEMDLGDAAEVMHLVSERVLPLLSAVGEREPPKVSPPLSPAKRSAQSGSKAKS